MEKLYNEEDFEDLRPYSDSECVRVIDRLMDSNELFFGLGRLAFPRLSRFSPSLAALISRWIIASRVSKVKDIESFQLQVMRWFFFRMLKKTTHGITYEWDEPLESGGHLFLSNHRDIAVDPAVVCYCLNLNKLNLPMIGIGDNLLTNPIATDIMKLNQSFIVQRSFASMREMIKTLTKLSHFIRFSTEEQGKGVWLAHREGRAKDSRDRTSPAVLKMLRLSVPKDKSWKEALAPLKIRTASISYQYDPCVFYKAKALLKDKKLRKRGGDAEQMQTEDNPGLHEMTLGVSGFKGKVHVAFGCMNPLHGADSLDTIVAGLDREIIGNHKLFNTNFYCLQKLVELGLESQDIFERAVAAFKPDSVTSKLLAEQFAKEDMSEEIYHNCLRIYANPVIEKLEIWEQEQKKQAQPKT